MSKYRKMATRFSSRADLRQALKAAGVQFEECRPGQENHLVGYQGDKRPETATFIVRRDQIGHASNDLGYHWNGRGFEEVVSDFDSRQEACTQIRQAVKREYAVVTATAAAKAKGFQVKRLDQADGSVQLQVVGRM